MRLSYLLVYDCDWPPLFLHSARTCLLLPQMQNSKRQCRPKTKSCGRLLVTCSHIICLPGIQSFTSQALMTQWNWVYVPISPHLATSSSSAHGANLLKDFKIQVRDEKRKMPCVWMVSLSHLSILCKLSRFTGITWPSNVSK